MTVRACIIGYPVKHSRSPLIHNHWIAEHGLDGAYERAEVAPDAVAAFLRHFADTGYAGGNITVPHKETAFRLARVDDPVATALEAVNLLWLEDGTLRGANTDVEGFLANLDERSPGWDDRLDRAVVLGAGGAARAVLHGLLARGARSIIVLNRSRPRAEELAARFGPRVVVAATEDAAAAFAGTSLLVNATSLGMAGQPPLDLLLDGLPETALVNDLVYVPLETGLLQAARARGNPTVDGLGMLLHQAVPSFERWFGLRPTVTPELRALVLADLAAAAA
jgi:shikimate dehydrogenase